MYFQDFDLAEEASRMPSFEMLEPTHSLLDGKTEISNWHSLLKPLIVKTHFANTALARKKQLSVYSRAHLYKLVSRDLRALGVLAKEYEADPQGVKAQPLNEDGIHPFTERVSALCSQGYSTYENMKMWTAAENGFPFACRLLSAIECDAVCASEAARGWMPISEMVKSLMLLKRFAATAEGSYWMVAPGAMVFCRPRIETMVCAFGR